MLKLMASIRPTPILKAPIFVPPDAAVKADLVRLIAATRRSLAAAHGAPGACAAIKPAKSAARTTLRAFTPASRPQAEAGSLETTTVHLRDFANQLTPHNPTSVKALDDVA
jgi:hypothetical protein